MKYSEQEVRKVVREELKRTLHEAQDAADMTIEVRRVLQQDVNTRMNKIIKSLKQSDPDMADWAEGIQEDVQDVMEELYDLGNEISIR
jgi:glutamyl-tRNA reductase